MQNCFGIAGEIKILAFRFRWFPNATLGWKEVGSDILSRAAIHLARPARRLTISRPRTQHKRKNDDSDENVQDGPYPTPL